MIHAVRRATLAVALTLSPLLAARADAPLPDLHWRLLGPFRGGWSTVAAGIAEQPDTFLFGAAGGGVWKTTNAGLTWTPVFDGAGPSSSVGALAIAASDPDTLYVGTGQPEPRYDIAAGDGVYRSRDGGRSWTRAGLEATRHIGAILVDPHDRDTVLVGAMGHLFGPNAERGIFRSSDGGAHWTQVLAIDADTGVVDLAADPADPAHVYAAAWQWRNHPWLSYFTPIEGAGSAIYESRDGGRHWRRLGGEGWPDGALGRIGLAVAHAATGTRVYASVASERGAPVAGLYRSDDGGAHWQRVNDAAAVTSWYNSRLALAPGDPDTVYALGQSIHVSHDGGRSFTILRGAPGGDDYHQLWINPRHPERMAVASDQGTAVSVDGGASWSSWYNQPTGQFYHLAADTQFPYRIYAGQQDSGTVSIASRSDYGALSFRDWHPVGGDERDHDVPDPNDPDLVYASGLGGKITRWDARSGQSRVITPWPVSSYGARPTTVRYRYTWITPLAATKRALYVGAQQLWRSTDRGEHWRVVSPDLTGQVAGAPRCDGNVATADATACGYGVIYAIAPSPRRDDMLWIGTDNGRVQLTRDGGRHWTEVTPPGVPAWSRIDSIDPSALDDGTAYVAVDNHRQDDFAPHAWRTHDHGRSWQAIDGDLPREHFVTVVRADPERRGLLYAGTDAGVYVSLDDGGHWQPLQFNLPQAWVRDLLVHGRDLIAATQGRALWLLDDLTPLRHAVDGDATRLVPPAVAYRVHANNNKDTPLPLETPLGENPPDGAVIDYVLGPGTHERVTLEIRDARGALVRAYASDDAPEPARAHRYFAEDWLRPAPRLATTPGAHRFVWNLRHPRPQAIAYEYAIAATPGRDTPTAPAGAWAVPGRYTVVLRVDGRDYRAPLELRPDPRVPATTAALARALRYEQAVGAALKRAWLAQGEIEGLRRELAALQPALAGETARMAAALREATAPLLDNQPGVDGDLPTISAVLAGLAADLESADAAPTPGQDAAFADYRARLDAGLRRWSSLRRVDLDRLNLCLAAEGRPRLVLPTPAQFDRGEDGGGKDLP